MPNLYDGNGNQIEISGSSSSDFGVTEYASYEDDNGSARQAKLTYQGKVLYPINQQAQRQDLEYIRGRGFQAFYPALGEKS